jgi:(R,R)-butanediol dehydrogenase / meso-butanediol dehydrogenase / diacetyl reductase
LKAAVFHGKQQFAVESMDDPVPEPDQVVVRVEYCGICGSDLHMADSDMFPVPPQGVVFGHEFAGEVVEVGSAVDRGRIGQKVAVVPYNFCGQCEYCRVGRISICQNATNVIGLGTLPGGLAEFVVAGDSMTVPLPDGVTTKAGALAEPVAVAHHGVALAGISAGQSALVVGCGPIGALTIEVLLASGVESLIASEPSSFRRGLASRLGAPVTVDPTAQDLGEKVRRVAGPLGVDFVLECSGHPQAIAAALEVLRPGGTLMELGVGLEPVPIVPVMLVVREHIIRGAVGYSDYFASSLKLLQEGAIDVEAVISAVRPLEGVTQSFQELSAGADLCKVVIAPGPS